MSRPWRSAGSIMSGSTAVAILTVCAEQRSHPMFRSSVWPTPTMRFAVPEATGMPSRMLKQLKYFLTKSAAHSIRISLTLLNRFSVSSGSCHSMWLRSRTMNEREKNSLSETASTARMIHGAVRTGKAISGAAKGAAMGGPYGAAIGAVLF